MKRWFESHRQKTWQKAVKLKDMLDAEAERYLDLPMNEGIQRHAQGAVDRVVDLFAQEEKVKGLKFKVLFHKECERMVITGANDFTRRFMTCMTKLQDFFFKVKVTA